MKFDLHDIYTEEMHMVLDALSKYPIAVAMPLYLKLKAQMDKAADAEQKKIADDLSAAGTGTGSRHELRQGI